MPRLPWTARRQAPPPAEVLTALELDDRTRVLAHSPLVGEGYVVITADEIAILTPVRQTVVRRPWTAVDHMAWDLDSRTLAVWWVGTRQAIGLELPEGSFVPEVAHERWRASVLHTGEFGLPGGRTGYLALRRHPDGSVTTQVNLPRGVLRTDPAVRAATDRAERLAREQTGLGAPGADADALGSLFGREG